MRKFTLQTKKNYEVAVSNSSCTCGSGTGSGGFHVTQNKKMSKIIKDIYKAKQNYRDVA